MNSLNICSTATTTGAGIQGINEGYCSSGFASLDSVDSLQLQNDLKNDHQPNSMPFQQVNEPQMNPFLFLDQNQQQKYSTDNNFSTGPNYNCKENQPNPDLNPQCNQQGKELMLKTTTTTNYDVNNIGYGYGYGYNYFDNHPEIPIGGVKYCFQPEALKCQNVHELFIPFQIIQQDQVKTTSALPQYKEKNPIPLRKKQVSTNTSNYYHHKSPFCSTIASKSEINGFGQPPEAKKRSKSKVFLVRDYSIKRGNEPQVNFVSYAEELLERKLNEYAFERSQNSPNQNYSYGTTYTTTTATPSTPASTSNNNEAYSTSNQSSSASYVSSSSSSSG